MANRIEELQCLKDEIAARMSLFAILVKNPEEFVGEGYIAEKYRQYVEKAKKCHMDCEAQSIYNQLIQPFEDLKESYYLANEID